MLSQRRRHSRWRMFLILSVFLGLVCNGELAPTSVSDTSSSSSSSTSTTTSHAKRKSQDIGSLSDFTWQAWLVMDPQAASQPGMDSATLLRRITPKSVFIAPALLPCPEGYKTDSMNRCVKNSFNLDEDAHISFLLQRLNTMYAKEDSVGNNKGEQKKSTGPLQLNIPLMPDFENIEHEEAESDSIGPIPSGDQTQLQEDEEKTKSHATVVVYEVRNDTALDGTTIFLQNSSTPHIGKVIEEKPDTATAAELVGETNGTDFTDTLNHKKPIEPLVDASSVESDEAAKDVTRNASTMDRAENSTKTSSTPLFSPTKSPLVNDSLFTRNDSAHLFTQTTGEIVIKVPDTTPAAKETTETWSIAGDERRENYESYANSDATPTNSKLNESREILYDEETDDAGYSSGSTGEPDEEKSLEVEDGEILKAGEAGMTIPMQNVGRPQRNRTTERKETIDVRDQLAIRFNDSTPIDDDKDEAGSNVSSEVTINGDLILETTLLDVSTERLRVTTKSPIVTRKIVMEDNGESKESSADGNLGSSKPEVVFPQDSRGVTSADGRKRGEQVEKNARAEELRVAPSSPKSLLSDPPTAADPIAEVAEDEADSKGSVLRESPRKPESDVFPASDFRQFTVNLGSAENLVRFPDYARQSAQQSGYVRFPSNEANSIHGPSYKQHPHHRPANDHEVIHGGDGSGGGGGGGGTKSSVLQKPVYYLSASPSWKPDRVDRAPATAGERQRQSPELLGFWSSMPLIRDPAMYPFERVNEAIDDDPPPFLPAASRAGVSLRAKTSAAENVDRLYAQKQRRTAITVA